MFKFRNIPKLGVVLMLALIVSFLYVWQEIQIFRLGYKIRSSEKRLHKLQEENTVLQLEISSLVNPQNIKREVRRLGMDLRPPKEKQIVRIK